MVKRLFVGNLSYAATEEQVRTLFSEVGTVASVSLVTDRETGQARGFGFVEMETEEAAQEAIAKLNGRELNRRNITVSEARPPQRQGGGRDRQDRGGFSRGGRDYNSRRDD
ncbi:MAG TPA: RNA-binding protein [Anaerolineae bacterium]|nr:RNA-binding protein [Anaerolineae bacterium]